MIFDNYSMTVLMNVLVLRQYTLLKCSGVKGHDACHFFSIDSRYVSQEKRGERERQRQRKRKEDERGGKERENENDEANVASRRGFSRVLGKKT